MIGLLNFRVCNHFEPGPVIVFDGSYEKPKKNSEEIIDAVRGPVFTFFL